MRLILADWYWDNNCIVLRNTLCPSRLIGLYPSNDYQKTRCVTLSLIPMVRFTCEKGFIRIQVGMIANRGSVDSCLSRLGLFMKVIPSRALIISPLPSIETALRLFAQATQSCDASLWCKIYEWASSLDIGAKGVVHTMDIRVICLHLFSADPMARSQYPKLVFERCLYVVFLFLLTINRLIVKKQTLLYTARCHRVILSHSAHCSYD